LFETSSKNIVLSNHADLTPAEFACVAHVHLFLDTNVATTKDVMHWELELASPDLLVLNGLKTYSLRRGDQVTVSANPARDGSNLGYARKVSHSAH
jgi:hypothetical protein